MIYNTLKALVAKHSPDVLFPLVDAAALFKLDIAPHRTLPKTWPADKQQHLMGNFSLPYPITAIEDQASVVVLGEKVASPTGLRTERIFVECMPSDAMSDSNAYADDIEVKMTIREMGLPPGSVCVCLGTIGVSQITEHSFLTGGSIQQVLVGTLDNLRLVMEAPTPEQEPQAYLGALRSAMTAIEEIIYVESLPGFMGWPDIDEAATRDGVFEIDHTGGIVTSDRYDR